jgi:hypothetical protein
LFLFLTRDAALEGPLFHGDVGSGISRRFATRKKWGRRQKGIA